MDGTTALPDDVLLDILFRLKDDRAALFRSATACKRWRRLIADPSFLRRCWTTEKELYSLAGIFAPERRQYLALAPSFVPMPRSAMGPGRRSLVSFLPDCLLLNGAKPLASRHGLLLVLLPTAPDTTVACPAVCDPLAGKFHVLPPLNDWDGDNYRGGCAILTSTDLSSAGFKVLVFNIKYGVYTFSSDEPTCSWTRMSSYIQCLDGLDIQVFQTNAVICHGTAHWLGYNSTASCLCTINVNPETGHVSMTKLMTNPRQDIFRHYRRAPYLSLDRDGTLSVIWMQLEHLNVEIWKPQDNEENVDEEEDTSTWHCTRVIRLKGKLKIPDKPWLRLKVLHILGEKCDMLLFHDHGQLYVAELKTGIMEEVVDWPSGHLDHEEAQPFEMDWSTFFVSRLGSQ